MPLVPRLRPPPSKRVSLTLELAIVLYMVAAILLAALVPSPERVAATNRARNKLKCVESASFAPSRPEELTYYSTWLRAREQPDYRCTLAAPTVALATPMFLGILVEPEGVAIVMIVGALLAFVAATAITTRLQLRGGAFAPRLRLIFLTVFIATGVFAWTLRGRAARVAASQKTMNDGLSSVCRQLHAKDDDLQKRWVEGCAQLHFQNSNDCAAAQPGARQFVVDTQLKSLTDGVRHLRIQCSVPEQRQQSEETSSGSRATIPFGPPGSATTDATSLGESGAAGDTPDAGADAGWNPIGTGPLATPDAGPDVPDAGILVLLSDGGVTTISVTTEIVREGKESNGVLAWLLSPTGIPIPTLMDLLFKIGGIHDLGPRERETIRVVIEKTGRNETPTPDEVKQLLAILRNHQVKDAGDVIAKLPWVLKSPEIRSQLASDACIASLADRSATLCSNDVKLTAEIRVCRDATLIDAANAMGCYKRCICHKCNSPCYLE